VRLAVAIDIEGWDFIDIAIDDATRLAYAEVLSDEKGSTAVGFLRRVIALFKRHGITVEAVLTDNGSAYISTVHPVACRALGIHVCTGQPAAEQRQGRRASTAPWSAAGRTAARSRPQRRTHRRP
jgi:hypothetical protein